MRNSVSKSQCCGLSSEPRGPSFTHERTSDERSSQCWSLTPQDRAVPTAQVIDPEFAFYGPMGFDLGALIGNLLLAYCAVPGNGQRDGYDEWLLEQVRKAAIAGPPLALIYCSHMVAGIGVGATMSSRLPLSTQTLATPLW